MTFRDQQAHDAERKRVQDRLDKEERERKRRDRKELWGERWASTKVFAKGTGVILAIVGFGIACAGLIILVMEAMNIAYLRSEERAQEEHRALLEELRHHYPAGIDQDTWLWCVDHCARYGNHEGDEYAEGVVTDVFLDYRSDPPEELITVYGPWLDSEQQIRISYETDMEELDPPGTHFNTGDLIRITTVHEQHHDSYTFRRIHRGD